MEKNDYDKERKEERRLMIATALAAGICARQHSVGRTAVDITNEAYILADCLIAENKRP